MAHCQDVHCIICTHGCIVCDAIVSPGQTLCDRHACQWCADETRAVIDDGGDEARCLAHDAYWFPTDLSPNVVAAFKSVGMSADITSLGGGYRAIVVSRFDGRGRALYITDGDGGLPSSRRMVATHLDEDDDAGDTIIAAGFNGPGDGDMVTAADVLAIVAAVAR